MENCRRDWKEKNPLINRRQTFISSYLEMCQSLVLCLYKKNLDQSPLSSHITLNLFDCVQRHLLNYFCVVIFGFIITIFFFWEMAQVPFKKSNELCK